MKWPINTIFILVCISIKWIDEVQCTNAATRVKRYGEFYPQNRARDSSANTQTRFANSQAENPCEWKIPQRPNFNNLRGQISQNQCAKYVWDIWSLEANKTKSLECTIYKHKQHNGGSSQRPNIIGGQDAQPAEFPHIGAVGWRLFDGNLIFKCGSSLLSPNYVLTAGHCTYSARDNRIVSPIPEIVRLGITSLTLVTTNINAVDMGIRNIIKHPYYAPPSKYNDIALMQLSRNVELSAFIQPACLWNTFDTSKIRTKISAAGWGVTNTGSQATADILQTGELDIIDSNICNELFAQSCNRQWCGVQSHQMCAGKLTGGVDACQGDSGGPLQAVLTLPANLKRKMYYILGVTSFGFGCARANSPGVYTRVSSYLDWIESIVWAEDR